MKNIIITCTLLAGISITSSAQTANSPQTVNGAKTNANATANAATNLEKVAEQRAKTLEKQLNLVPGQYKAVYEAELDYIRQEQQLRANGTQPGPGQAMQMQMGKDMKIQRVLNNEQNAKYQAMKPKPANN